VKKIPPWSTPLESELEETAKDSHLVQELLKNKDYKLWKKLSKLAVLSKVILLVNSTLLKV